VPLKNNRDALPHLHVQALSNGHMQTPVPIRFGNCRFTASLNCSRAVLVLTPVHTVGAALDAGIAHHQPRDHVKLRLTQPLQLADIVTEKSS
jgi:hypothetical protein